ncbi:Transcription factor fungi [Macrophomina phaseolina MS6]|uniref:Transcription factor fungi n=1 Tax=Macrophomina phaseolina (strain MS6) TaxID=1126212 RepID=K2SC29_MACPH|nr:Transcription factor fungi [Macrophomina phaseolina MS6]
MAEVFAFEGIGLQARIEDAPDPYLSDVQTPFNQRSPSLFTFSVSEDGDAVARRPSCQATPSASAIDPRLPARLHALIGQLSDLPHDPTTPTSPPFNTPLAHFAFTPASIAEFTNSYFLAMHPHFPLLHRPTYRPSHASLPLLLAVSLAGAAASAPRDHALSARQFFGVGERLASLTFLWDCYVTIGSGSPPQMATAELRGDMPCTERLYEAETASEFAYLQPAEQNNNCRRSLRDLVATFFEDEWRESQKVLLTSAMTQLRLLLLICAVNSVLSQNRACVLGQTTLASIWRATVRWKELFDRESEVSWRLVQYRHLDIPFKDRSLEFLWLAQKIVREIDARGDTCEYLQNIGDDSYQSFHAFLLAGEEAAGAATERPRFYV